MISIKEYNKKIISLKNMGKMTKTMKMVSASKFKKAYKAQINAKEYAAKLSELIARLARAGSENHPLFKIQKTATRALIILFTSDKGLCGAFNNNLIRKTRSWAQDNRHKYATMDMSFCGRRGYMSFRRSARIRKYYENITVKPDFNDALNVAQDMTTAFIKEEYDEIYLAYNHFNGPLSQTPVIEKILPLEPSVLVRNDMRFPNAYYTYEPQETQIFSFLIPKFLSFKIFFVLLENAAGEHGARMSAMDKASQNTVDLIDRYTLLRNRARQAGITTELIEVISGAEALK